MPNHCDNSTTIFGPPDEVAKLLKAMTIDGKTRLCNLFPMPKGLENTEASFISSPELPEAWLTKVADGSWTQEEYDEAASRWKASWEAGQANKAKYGYTDWYSWALQNWGTKWGDYDHYGDFPNPDELEEVGVGVVSFTLGYQTAWAPFSDTFWKVVSIKFPTIRFETRYQEPGMGFAGVTIAYQDVVVDNGTDQLPEVDWDNDDAHESWSDLMDKLLDEIYDDTDKELAEALTGDAD